jgi:glycosyltransferase involved in cell wall biosynthesis
VNALILLAYYNRPQMVRGALESLRRQGDAPWRCVMVDDGSEVHGQSVVEREFPDLLPRMEFIRIEDTMAQKIWQGGSRHPQFMNEAIEKATEDLVVVLCDDDALVAGILDPLLRWHMAHPAEKWSYGHVSVYDPSKEPVPWDAPHRLDWHLNRRTDPIFPAYIVDSSQVAFMRHGFTGFPAVNTKNCDAALFNDMGRKWGRCPFNGLVLQHKGIMRDQMGNRRETAIYKVGVA